MLLFKQYIFSDLYNNDSDEKEIKMRNMKIHRSTVTDEGSVINN